MKIYEGMSEWLLSPKRFSEKYPEFPLNTLRYMIFRAKPHMENGTMVPGNGMQEARIIIRIGRKVLIHVPRFFQWLDEKNGAPPGDEAV